jgi:hypothetical protein
LINNAARSSPNRGLSSARATICFASPALTLRSYPQFGESRLHLRAVEDENRGLARNISLSLRGVDCGAGWSYCVKSLIYFVYPKHGMRTPARVKVEKSRKFIARGALIVGYACLLAYSIYGK